MKYSENPLEIPEFLMHEGAHWLSMGLDCNVSTAAYTEAVVALFLELETCGWTISPMTKKPKENQNKEPEDKFDATVKRMLETPPKPHKPVKEVETKNG